MTGARSLPLNRAMLVILRAYVNPATGVRRGIIDVLAPRRCAQRVEDVQGPVLAAPFFLA
jgi:hypothetical protein